MSFSEIKADPKDYLVIYHGGCLDGFTAAWAAWKILGDEAEYTAEGYDKDPPDVTGKHVMIVDFSYPRKVLLEMNEKAESLVVFDHHKTAAVELEGIPFVLFDQERSGASITWDVLHGGCDTRPKLVNYIEDSDLWKFDLPNTMEFRAYSEAIPFEFDSWESLASLVENDFPQLLVEAEVISRYRMNMIQKNFAHEKPHMANIAGYTVPIANSKIWQSEIGNELARGSDTFAAAWFMKKDGSCGYSLRSDRETGLDVSEIAKQFGGGGHKNAAGFRSNAPPMMIKVTDED